MPHLIAFLGSARSDGHTAALLARLIDGLESVEVIDLNAVRIQNGFHHGGYGEQIEIGICHR